LSSWAREAGLHPHGGGRPLGFVLDQGGTIPGNAIRVVDVHGLVHIIAGNKACDSVFGITFPAPPGGQIAPSGRALDREIKAILGCGQGDVEKNCIRLFAQWNRCQNTTKNLAMEASQLRLILPW
jgi:hypothetical protein